LPVFILLPFWLISYSHLYFFLLVRSAVRPNRAFDPSTQFPLVIFDLETLVAAFDLLSCRAALHCVIRLWHYGAASPPPPLPLRKRPQPIASPSPFSFPVTGTIEPYKRRDESTLIIHRTHHDSSSSRPEPSLHRSTIGRLC
jgi:hypothetical protein